MPHDPSTPVRPTGPAASVRTAVVWEVLSAALAEADPHGRGLDVVDAGGGTGGFAVPLAEAGHRVTVVDELPDALDTAAGLADEGGGVSGGVLATGSVVTAAEVRMLLGTTNV